MKAMIRCPDSYCRDVKKRERKRSVLTRYDESEEEVLLGKNERFKMEASLPILNSLTSELTKRAEAYSLIGNLFPFFCEFKTISSDELKNMYEHLANGYHKNLDYGDLLNECEHIKHYMVLDENCETLPALHRKIISDNLKYVFPNVDIAPNSVHVHDGIVNNLTGERIVFKTESYLKKSMSQHNGAAAV